MDKKRSRRVALAVVAAAVLPFALGACGSSGSSSASPGPSAQGGNSSTSASDAGMVQFAQCMTQNGVPWKDPKNGHFIITGSNPKNNPNYSSALAKCQHYLGPGGLGSNSQKNSQAALAFDQCMQDHGQPVPESTNGAVTVGGSGVNRNSPQFKNAFNACKSELPGGGPGFTSGGQG